MSEAMHSENQQSNRHILFALMFGVLIGWLLFRLRLLWPESTVTVVLERYVIEGLVQLVGQAFIALLKVLVVPLVFFSLICGVCASGSGQNMSRMGLRTFVFYLGTTAAAITLALLLAFMIDPGSNADLAAAQSMGLKQPPTVFEMLLDIFPVNILAAMAEGKMLQIIVFAILVGVGLLHSGASGQRLLAIFEDCNTLMLKLVELIMRLAPVGVFSLVAYVFASEGVGFMLPLLAYICTVLLALAIHAGFSYPMLLWSFTRANPLRLIRKMQPALLFAFSTASSSATLPVSLRLVEKAVGVRNSVAAFTMPLGATLNMDGTAIMQGVATVFIASAYGQDLLLTDYLMVILVTTLASIGTAAVPSAGLVTLAVVLAQVGLPEEAIGLIIGVDRLLDMSRTAVNVLGDSTVTTVVAYQEKLWDKEAWDSDEGLAQTAE